MAAMENINIGIQENDRKSVVQLLDSLLADEYVLYTKTKNYHWNVVGPQFNDLHKFFQTQYEDLDSMIDEIAERTRALGDKPLATLAEFVKNSRLKESPGDHPPANTMLANLLADHEAVIRTLRTDAEACAKHNDMGTNDFLIGLMEKHEKMAWMLRSFTF